MWQLGEEWELHPREESRSPQRCSLPPSLPLSSPLLFSLSSHKKLFHVVVQLPPLTQPLSEEEGEEEEEEEEEVS